MQRGDFMYNPNMKYLSINQFNGGLNVSKPETEIFDSQAASCLNVINNQLVGLDSRYGYTKYYSSSITTTQIKSVATYNAYGSSFFVMSYGKALYLDLRSSSNQIWSALASSKTRSFEMNGNIYFLDGANYIQYSLGV
jgi:hypothetical protein